MSAPPESGPGQFGPQFHSKSGDGERHARRSFSPIAKQAGLRDVDAQQRSVRFNAALAALPGAILGGALAYFLSMQYGFGTWIFPVSMLVFGAGATIGTLVFVDRAAAVARTVYAPGGRTPLRNKEYSYAESLALRGEYEDAISAFELAIAEEDPGDPVPYLRIARIYRDNLARPQDAERWLKRALSDSDMHGGLVSLTRKELVELYRTKLNEPQKAAPMLARLAEEAAGTPEGEWAARELTFVKEQMRGEMGS